MGALHFPDPCIVWSAVRPDWLVAFWRRIEYTNTLIHNINSKTKMKLSLLLFALIAVIGCNSSVNTSHFTFDGSVACLKDTVVATVDSSGLITHINSPTIQVTVEKDSSGKVITIINACNIGNIFLLIGLIGGAIIGYHIQNPSAYFPDFLIKVSSIMGLLGGIGKVITMFFGVTKPEEITTLVNSTNKALNKTTGDDVATDPLTIKTTETK